jgi:hypothetical protein
VILLVFREKWRFIIRSPRQMAQCQAIGKDVPPILAVSTRHHPAVVLVSRSIVLLSYQIRWPKFRSAFCRRRTQPYRSLLAFLHRFCSNSIMETLRKRSLEKTAGNSIIAWGVASFPMSLTTGTLDCGALFVIWAGIAVRSGSRTGSLFALLFSALGFTGDVATMVSAASYGVAEIGGMRVTVAVGFALWMLLNMALLSELRRWPLPGEFSHSGNESAASADKTLTLREAEAAGDAAGDAVWVPIPPSHRRFPQFSLRSLFALAILVALGSAIGTQSVELPRQWTRSWTTGGKAGKDMESWSVDVAAFRSGIPAVGYLRHSLAKSADRPRSSYSYGSRASIRVNGQTIAPGRKFVLVFRDGEDEPQRLEVPKEEAAKVFGSHCDNSAIEKFWRETIEPLRKASVTTPRAQ